jgi:two-component system, LytTR family, sensor kinase
MVSRLPARRGLLKAAGLAALGYFLLVALTTLELYTSRVAAGLPPELLQPLVMAALVWLSWGFLLPATLWLVRRLPLSREGWPLRLPLHAGAAVLLTALHSALFLALAFALLSDLPQVAERGLAPVLAGNFLALLRVDPFLYGAVLVTVTLLAQGRARRERRLSAAALERELAEARLGALQAQLRPHFLFNTLHSIHALIHLDRAKAQEMTRRLRHLLERTLGGGSAWEVPLEEELEVLESYLAIERTRFSDRLSVEVEVEPAARAVLVPSLILQPLMENAVRHGVAPRPEPGRVVVRARLAGELLELVVADDGAGPPPGGVRERHGLGNTRSRLRHLHGAAGELAISRSWLGGFQVTVRLPARTVERAAGSSRQPPAEHPQQESPPCRTSAP